jgi:hypothetical protein
MFRKLFSVCLPLFVLLAGCQGLEKKSSRVQFEVTADIRQFSGEKHSGSDYFDGVCEAILQSGSGQFMISPGDIDPPQPIYDTVQRHMGPAYTWYPVVGNHEAETPEDMEWLRSWGSKTIPGLVRRGPAGTETTTFSFDRGPVHFVVLNQYFDGSSDVGARGDMVPALYEWLKNDLDKNRKKMVLVIGHEPILPIPDMDNGRLRHETDSLNQHVENCRRFHDLLLEKKVTAYFCAHTHNASITNLNGLWQIDAGHARGKGDPGAPSTFLKARASSDVCTVEFHRQMKPGEPYQLRKTFELRRPE